MSGIQDAIEDSLDKNINDSQLDQPEIDVDGY